MRTLAAAGMFGLAALAAALAFTWFTGPEQLFVVLGPAGYLRLAFGVSALAVPFLIAIAALAPAVALWSIKRAGAYDAALASAFVAAMILVLTARTVAAFVLAWECMALISAFLVATHHERRAVRRATFTYLIVSQLGALCLSAALVMLAVNAGDGAFAAMAQASQHMPANLRAVAFALAFIGFGSKAGLMPLHFWLPRAHPVAPANGSALLSGLMLKIAVYGLMLFTLVLCAPAPAAWGLWILLVGAVSAVGGVLYALVDRDLKRVLAYSSVENIGIIAIGLGVTILAAAHGMRALAALALSAALFHALNHALFKGLLFLGSGTIAQTFGTTDLERLGGVGRRLVWTAPIVLVGALAIAGIPPFNGFVSEWMTLNALIAAAGAGEATHKTAIILAIAALALTGGLAVALFAKIFGVVFLGDSRGADNEGARERFDAFIAGQALLGCGCALLGLIPLVAVTPLALVASRITGTAVIVPAALPVVAASLALLPLLAAFGTFLIAERRGIRRVAMWSCGSPAGPRNQYTARAFSQPLRMIFALALAKAGAGDDPVDRAIRNVAARFQHAARALRIVQSGRFRVYLAYALAAVVFAVLVAR